MTRLCITLASVVLLVVTGLPAGSATAQSNFNLPVDPARVLDEKEKAKEAQRIREADIKSITTWSYIIGPGGVSDGRYRTAHVTYDSSGNPLEHTSFKQDGSIIQSAVHQYDDAGHLVGTTSRMPELVEGEVRVALTYDEDDFIVSMDTYKPDGSLLMRAAYGRDFYGNLADIISESPDGLYSFRIEVDYNDNGYPSETTMYGREGELMSRSTTTYDADGGLMEETSYAPDGSVGMRTIFTYGESGLLLEVAVRNSDDVIINRTLHEYDDDGNAVATTTISPTAGTESRVTMEYDDAGNVTSVLTFNKLNQLVGRKTYEYEFHGEESGTDQD